MTDEKTKQLIADMVGDMCFDRKKPAARHEKAMYSILKNSLGDTINGLNKLHLRLWHAVYKGDYHSLSLGETESALKEARQRIDNILKENF
ncbi:MAG: hypothetical protein PHO15_11880 [Eubacteriales bacterium]|nr:hypothetical protein [Eubacteriales bacterium]